MNYSVTDYHRTRAASRNTTRGLHHISHLFSAAAVLGLSLFLIAPLFLPAVVAAEEGFVPLFNGRDLSGWVNVNCAPNTFTVREGMIISTGVPTGVMRTAWHYENFILELEWKHLKKGGNAGLFIYSEPITAPGVPFAKAIEVQILDGNSPEGVWTGHGDVFSIHGAKMTPDRPHPRGWERCLPSENRAKPAGEWNHYRVESQGGRLTLAVNGKVVSGASQCRPRKGYICLEAEGSECHFRNIRIQELPSSNPPPEEMASLDQGFKSLYTGIDLSGWKKDSGHEGHWTAKDWILNYDGQSEAEDKNLWSEKSHGDFTLICDWRGKATLDQDQQIELPVLFHPKFFLKVKIKEPIKEWNRYIITRRGEQFTVELNGQKLLSQVPLSNTGIPIPTRGPIALRHHNAPVQFANIYIKSLD